MCIRYGLGIIYYRQEKYALAEYHFTRALSINGQSSVLHCYLGMVLQVRDTKKKNSQAVDRDTNRLWPETKGCMYDLKGNVHGMVV